MSFKAFRGKSYPLGSTITDGGVNFSVYSKRADYMELLLFDSEDSPRPSSVHQLIPELNRTHNYWHIFLAGCRAGQVYAWRAHGRHEPWRGLRFDGNKVLIDPYARGIVGWQNYSRKAATEPGDNCATSLRSVVVDIDSYDWGDDRSPAIPYARTVIYELHVGGFTLNPNSKVSAEKRGTYAGLIEKLPYLKDLGITTIELMPVQAFDKFDAPPGLTNYWGYTTAGFFAPHMEYSSVKTADGAVREFRDLVKACHAQGMEVILDVVFNHTTENNELGPTISLKGFDNLTYYTLDPYTYAYQNFSGCGNSLRAEHPIVGRLILDSLRFWVQDMHVDGFRFDLASVLSRDIYGAPVDRPPVLWAILSDPVLASVKLIAEAWDPAGLYQVGLFVTKSDRFAEWNGPFRDDVRRFVKADKNTVVPLAYRLTGSSDIYVRRDRDPNRSINLITCHDGFTLNDLVSYNQKHNDANLEDNRDGHNDNCSWNCGVEGETEDAAIEELRLRQIKNLLAILFLSQGTPMLTMGDEVRRSQRGNNNAYCQNNVSNWFDWSLVEKNSELLNFTKHLIGFVQQSSLYSLDYVLQDPIDDADVSSDSAHLSQTHADLPAPSRSTRETETHEHSDMAESPRFARSGVMPAPMPPVLERVFKKATLRWHGVALNSPDFGADSHSLAFEIEDPISGEHLYAAFNSYWEPLYFKLPLPKEGESWHRVIDTAGCNLENYADLAASPVVHGANVRVQARSTAVFANRKSLSGAQPQMKTSRALMREHSITWFDLKSPEFPG